MGVKTSLSLYVLNKEQLIRTMENYNHTLDGLLKAGVFAAAAMIIRRRWQERRLETR